MALTTIFNPNLVDCLSVDNTIVNRVDNVSTSSSQELSSEDSFTSGSWSSDDRRSGTSSGTSEEIVVITVPQPIPKSLSGAVTQRQPFTRKLDDPTKDTNRSLAATGRRDGRNKSQRDFSRVRMVIGQETTLMVPLKKVRPIFRGPLRTVDLYQNKQLRAGVIVYVEIPNANKPQLFFCLGLDQRTGDITDFGGGVTKKDPTALHAALREFHEETLGIFTEHVPLTPMISTTVATTIPTTPSAEVINSVVETLHPQLHDALAIWSDRSLVVFVKLDPGKLADGMVLEGSHNWSGFMRSFVDRYQTAKAIANEPEVSNIVWVSRHDLETMIGRKAVGDHRMYDRIRSLLNGGGQFYDLL